MTLEDLAKTWISEASKQKFDSPEHLAFAAFTDGFRSAALQWVPIAESPHAKDLSLLFLWQHDGASGCTVACEKSDGEWLWPLANIPKESVTHWLQIPGAPIKQEQKQDGEQQSQGKRGRKGASKPAKGAGPKRKKDAAVLRDGGGF